MNAIRPVHTTEAPPPGGHYSQAVVWENMILVSGQLPVCGVSDHRLAAAPFADQAYRAFQNLMAVLGSAGAGPEDILKVTIYITDTANWPMCNEIFAQFLGEHRPARSVVPGGPLHHGYQIEVDAIARRSDAAG